MSNRLEIISKAVENLEQAVFSMSEKSNSPATSTNQQQISPIQTQQQQTVAASQSNDQTQPVNMPPKETVVGHGKKHGFFGRFGRKKQNPSNNVNPANMVEA